MAGPTSWQPATPTRSKLTPTMQLTYWKQAKLSMCLRRHARISDSNTPGLSQRELAERLTRALRVGRAMIPERPRLRRPWPSAWRQAIGLLELARHVALVGEASVGGGSRER